MRRTLKKVLMVCSLVFAGDAAFAGKNHLSLQSLTLDHIFKLEQLSGGYSFSPDGRYITFVLKRPLSDGPDQAQQFSNDRADVWLYDREKNTSINLTRGARDKSSAWYPSWSPNGQRLALLSSRGESGRNARVWVWERGRSEIRLIGDRYADLDNDVSTNDRPNKLIWISDAKLVFRARPGEIGPTETRATGGARNFVIDQWAQSALGQRDTGLVFESGRELVKEDVTRGETFASCDVENDRCKDLVSTYLYEDAHEAFSLAVMHSRAARAVATYGVRSSAVESKPGLLNSNRYRIDLFDEDGERHVPSLGAVANVVPGTLRWSSDGKQMAFVGSSERTEEELNVFVLDLHQGRLREASVPGAALVSTRRLWFQPEFKLMWGSDGKLVIGAERTNPSGVVESGWWRLAGKNAPINLTAKLPFLPERLWPSTQGTFIVAGDGSLWCVTPSAHADRLTSHPNGEALSILWTDARPEEGGVVKHIVYAAGSGAAAQFYYYDVAKRAVRRIPVPAVSAEFKAFSLVTQEAVFVSHSRDGSRIWLSSIDADQARIIFGTNEFLAGVAEGDVSEFDYLSHDGQRLKAWLILPIGYERGRRYPLVTWVYQSQIYTQRPLLSHVWNSNPLNLQLLAARGYAVLLPSMPGRYHDYASLKSGVIPAVDVVINAGIADPEKLAVMGHSNGGYSTYGLITQTNRFKAAVAIAGITDLSSWALQFKGPPFMDRMSSEMGLTYTALWDLEQQGYGLPWSSDLYTRYSPISYVAQVRTPLLQIHGDLDYVPVQQAEFFFSALQRLGKRARFVRYFGEGHVMQSPANIRHSWNEIFAWLDAHLGIGEDRSAH